VRPVRNFGMHRLLASLLLAAPLLPAFAGQVLTPYAAEYRIKISVLGGKLNTRVETTATGYMAESVIRATGMSRLVAGGSIREKSWFTENGERILPVQYRSSDTLSSDHETVGLDFDWDRREVTGLIDGKDFFAELEGDVHDRVSLQYGLMYDLLTRGESGQYQLQDAAELKHLTITNIGMRPVEVPFGKFEAVGIQHQRIGSSRTTTLWCVEELGYLPVIIEQHRKGKRQMRAELTEYEVLSNGPAGP